MFIIGVLCVKINYDADAQRQHARKHGEGYKIWGKTAKFIKAQYKIKKIPDGRQNGE